LHFKNQKKDYGKKKKNIFKKKKKKKKKKVSKKNTLKRQSSKDWKQIKREYYFQNTKCAIAWCSG
jgi:hypothetical protein